MAGVLQSELGTWRSVERSATDAPLEHDVTIVCHDLGSVGGMERVLEELVLGLRRLGHRVTVIGRTCSLPADAGVDFHRVRGPGRPFLLAYPWFLLAGTVAVRRWRRGIVQATGAIVCNKVDVIAVHYCHHVGPANPSRTSLIFRGHIKLAGALKRVGERICYRLNRAATFVCVSEGVAEEMGKHFPMLAERLITIHNGVDLEMFAPRLRDREAGVRRRALRIADERLVALLIGGEWERKGLEPLIRALALAPGWTVVVAGEGDWRSYQGLADSLGVSEAVRWLGVTSDVQLLYQLADAFVLPSSYETFSLVTFEAAASGLPILATPVSGVRELVRDGENGFLIGRDSAGIAESLRKLGEDAALRKKLGQAARESALAFSWEQMVAKHHRLYRAISAQAN